MDIDKLILSGIDSQVEKCFSSLMDIDKLIPFAQRMADPDGFSSLMDIDKLILRDTDKHWMVCFSSLMDIDKLIPSECICDRIMSFSSLMDIDKLILASPHFTSIYYSLEPDSHNGYQVSFIF